MPKISELNAATSIGATDVVPIVQGSETKKLTVVDIAGQARTAAETTANVTPSAYQYAPGDVRRYGAVGDGSTDDTSALNKALSQANSGGEPVKLQAKTYLLSTWTAYSNTAAIRIEGNGGTLKGPAVTVDFLSPAANFHIEGVTFDRWNSAVERLLAGTGSFTQIVYRNNKHINCTGQVFNLERPYANVRIEGNEFDTCTGGYAIKLGENTYANQSGYEKAWIIGNKFKSLSASSTTSCAAMLIYGVDCLIDGNDIDGISQSGTGEAWGIYTKVINARISNNRVKTVDASGSSDVVGINIKGTTRSVTTSPQGYSVVCSHNQVSGIGLAGTRGAGIRAQTDDVLIANNFSENAGLSGISTDETTAHGNIRICNNVVSFSTVTAGTVGVRLEGTGTAVVAESNTVRRAETGIRLTTGGSASNDMVDGQVRFNVMRACTYGIIFDAFTGATLSYPLIEGNTVDGGTYGMVNNGSGGTVSNLRVLRNDFARASTAVTGGLGTTPVARGNIGWLSASATWDAGSIADGDAAATTITVTGAALGDFAVASFGVSLGGLGYSAQVTEANTVEVRLLNNSGGAIDLASQTVRVKVEKG